MDNINEDSDIGEYVHNVEDTDDEDNDISQFELVPRAVVTPSVSKRSDDWTDLESSVLLEAWGEKLLENNRKHVRSEEWDEVVEKVSEVSECGRTKTNCRNRLDTLKKRYKKEKDMLAQGVGLSSTWVHFCKMDMILCPSLYRATGHGLVNSEAHLNLASSSNDTMPIVHSKVHTDCTNTSDKMKEIENSKVHPPRTTSSVEINDTNSKDLTDDFDHRLPKKTRMGEEKREEKIKSRKSEPSVELEKMRIDLIRNLELERRKILKRGQVEIGKICGVVIEDNDLSPGNTGG